MVYFKNLKILLSTCLHTCINLIILYLFTDPQMSATHSGRITRIITTDFPQYFAIITRIKQEVHVIGAEGGILTSSVANDVQAVFPPGALTKKIKVGLQVI